MRAIIVLGLMSLPMCGFAQQITHDYIGSGGSAVQTQQHIFSSTIGQPVIGLISTNDLIFSQGFQQADLTIVTSSDSWESFDGFQVYPNPTAGVLSIAVEDEFHSLQYRLDHLSGVSISQGMLTDGKIKMHDLPQGSYILSVYDEKRKQSIIIQKVN